MKRWRVFEPTTTKAQRTKRPIIHPDLMSEPISLGRQGQAVLLRLLRQREVESMVDLGITKAER